MDADEDLEDVESVVEQQPLLPDGDLPLSDVLSDFSVAGLDGASGFVVDSDNRSMHSVTQPLVPNVDPEPVPQSVYDRALFEASQLIQQSSQLSLPWESGVFAQIFGDDFPTVADPTDVLVHPVVPQTLHAFEAALEGSVDPATSSLKRATSEPFFAHVMTNKRDVDAKQEELDLWDKAISKWQCVFVVCKFSGVIGARLQLYAESHDEQDASRTILRDVLGFKSPRTAIKRADTLRKFFNWQLKLDCEPWPVHISRVMQYLTETDTRKPAASTGLALIEALRFAQYVMGIQVGTDILADPQFLGKTRILMTKKQELKQARPLLCTEVALLERFVMNSDEPGDVYLAGSCLFAIFSRSRWSDLRFMSSLAIDRTTHDGEPFGFIECRTSMHKTSTTLERKSRQMPVVCPVLGVTGLDWTNVWLDLCVQLGMDLDSKPLGALCRALDKHGSVTTRSCTSEEIGNFLNMILGTDSSNRVTSHSLKETTLSWSSKFGIEEDARTLLGHHELSSVGKSKSLATYSRDMLTRPLQLYTNMLSQIRSDLFNPDMSRSGWMLRQSGTAQSKPDVVAHDINSDDAVASTSIQPATSENIGGKQLTQNASQQTQRADSGKKPADERLESDSNIESTGTSSTESSSDSDVGEEAICDAVKHRRPDSHVSFEMDIDEHLFQNRKSKVVHRVSQEGTTVCGICANDKYEYLPNGASFKWARCGRCFKGEVISKPIHAAELLEKMARKREG